MSFGDYLLYYIILGAENIMGERDYIKCEKPVTENQKELANKIYTYLYREHRYCTKQEICEHLGWEYNSNSDRKCRDVLNTIKKRRPIVATPDRVGYFDKVECKWNIKDDNYDNLTSDRTAKTEEEAKEIIENLKKKNIAELEEKYGKENVKEMLKPLGI